MVVVFPNVIFDTSQVHANVVYPDMFAWLTDLLTVFDQHPETLFVLRAHPDEGRPGKESRETVEDWTRRQALSERANVVFLPPQPFVSSYELIRQAKLVLIYNSSVGLEAAILGKPVLSAGRARFGHLPLAGLAGDLAHYREMLEAHLAAPEGQLPVEHVATGRRWLYVEAFLASLDLSPFLTDDPGHPGMVRLRPFHPETLSDSPELTVIRDGILEGKPFLLAEEGRAEGRSRIEGEPSVR
jgi:hypothetical protein